MSNTKHSRSNRPLYRAHYQGRDLVDVLNYAVVHGSTYAEIRFEDGRIHTVPTDEIYLEEKDGE